MHSVVLQTLLLLLPLSLSAVLVVVWMVDKLEKWKVEEEKEVVKFILDDTPTPCSKKE